MTASKEDPNLPKTYPQDFLDHYDRLTGLLLWAGCDTPAIERAYLDWLDTQLILESDLVIRRLTERMKSC